MATLAHLREMPLCHVKGELAEFKFTAKERANPEVENLHRSRKEYHEVSRLRSVCQGVAVGEEEEGPPETIQPIPEGGIFPEAPEEVA